MKSLILILLAATYASAQTPTPSLADFARQERARQRDARNKNIKVYTTEDIRTTVLVDSEGKPIMAGGEVASQVAPTAAAATAATPDAKPAPTVDPVQLWFADTEKLREKIRELIDREATNQLEINRITNDVYKPDTNETAVARARAELGVAQEQLTATRELLAKTRLELQNRESDGPPKK